MSSATTCAYERHFIPRRLGGLGGGGIALGFELELLMKCLLISTSLRTIVLLLGRSLSVGRSFLQTITVRFSRDDGLYVRLNCSPSYIIEVPPQSPF